MYTPYGYLSRKYMYCKCVEKQLNFVLIAHQSILHKCIYAVEIDFLKYNFKKTYCLVSNIRMNNLLLSKLNV